MLELVRGAGALEQAFADQSIRISWSEFTSGLALPVGRGNEGQQGRVQAPQFGPFRHDQDPGSQGADAGRSPAAGSGPAIAAFDAGAIRAWTIRGPYFAMTEERPNTRVLRTIEGLQQDCNVYLANWPTTGPTP